MRAQAAASGRSATDVSSGGVRLIEDLLMAMTVEKVQQYYDGMAAQPPIPATGAQRRARLLIILDSLRSSGRPPSADEYRAEAGARREEGEDAVPLTTLEGYYGSYANAVKVAVKLHVRATAAHAGAGESTGGPRRYWTEERCFEQMERCRDFLGHWPSVYEFFALRRAGSTLANVDGWTGLDLPGKTTIQRLFGSYGEMLAAARSAVETRRRSRPEAQERATDANPAPSPPRRPRRSRQRSKNIVVTRVPS